MFSDFYFRFENGKVYDDQNIEITHVQALNMENQNIEKIPVNVYISKVITMQQKEHLRDII